MWMRPCRSPGFAHAVECRQGAERQVHLRDRAGHPVVANPLHEPGSSSTGSTSDSRVRSGSAFEIDRRRRHLFAVVEHDAGRPAVADQHPRDACVEADGRSGRARRLRQRAGQCAGSAFDRDRAAAGHRIDGRLPEQRGAGAPRPRPRRGTENAARRDRCLEQIAGKPFADEIRRRHRHPSQQAEAVGPAELSKAPAGLQQLPDLLRCRCVQRGRRSLQQRQDEGGEPLQRRAEFRIAVGILGGVQPDGSAERATSVERTSGRPPGESATRRGSGRRKSTRCASCMSATIDGRIGPIACASAGHRYPGASPQ